MELALKIWNSHIEVFSHFDLVSNNGHSLEDETRSNALSNAIVTLEWMLLTSTETNQEKIAPALKYLRGSKYYSDENKDTTY